MIAGSDRIVLLFLISFHCPPQAMHIHSILGMPSFSGLMSVLLIFLILLSANNT